MSCTVVNPVSLLLSIGTPLTMDEFAWTRTEAVFYNNLFYAGLAVIAIFSFVTVKILTKWFAGKK